MKRLLKRFEDGEILVLRVGEMGLLGGLLAPAVPEGAAALVRRSGVWRPSSAARVEEGMLLIRDAPFESRLVFDELPCSDGTRFRLEVSLLVRLSRDSEDVEGLLSEVLGSRSSLDRTQLERRLEALLKPYVKEALCAMEPEALFFGAEGERALSAALEEGAKEASFRWGLTLEQIVASRFGGEALAARARARREAAEKAAEIERLKRSGLDTAEALAVSVGLRKSGLTRAVRLFLAAGDKVVSLPAQALAEGRLAPDAVDCDVPVRSVRLLRRNETHALLAGTPRGVLLLDADTLRIEATFSYGDTRHGFNSMVLSGDSLLASHSDHGLLRWNASRPQDAPEKVFSRPARAVAIHDGEVYFASDRKAMRLGSPAEELFSASGRLTCMTPHHGGLICGGEDGRLYFFDLRKETLGQVSLGAKIYSVAVAELSVGDSVLVGMRAEGLRAVSLLARRIEHFACGERIRWTSGASDLIFGVSYGLRSLYVWRQDRPAHPRTLALPWPAHDVALLKEASDA